MANLLKKLLNNLRGERKAPPTMGAAVDLIDLHAGQKVQVKVNSSTGIFRDGLLPAEVVKVNNKTALVRLDNGDIILRRMAQISA